MKGPNGPWPVACDTTCRCGRDGTALRAGWHFDRRGNVRTVWSVDIAAP